MHVEFNLGVHLEGALLSLSTGAAPATPQPHSELVARLLCSEVNLVAFRARSKFRTRVLCAVQYHSTVPHTTRSFGRMGLLRQRNGHRYRLMPHASHFLPGLFDEIWQSTVLHDTLLFGCTLAACNTAAFPWGGGGRRGFMRSQAREVSLLLQTAPCLDPPCVLV